jgi:hypothetical protein
MLMNRYEPYLSAVNQVGGSTSSTIALEDGVVIDASFHPPPILFLSIVQIRQGLFM